MKDVYSHTHNDAAKAMHGIGAYYTNRIESKVSWPDKALDECKIDHNMYMGLERPIKQNIG